MKYLKIFEEFFDSWEEISPEEWYDSNNNMESQPFDETEYDTLVNFCIDNDKYKKGGQEYELDYDYVNPNSPDFFSTELNGYYATCLGNIEKCFQMGILLQEIKDVMVVNNTPSLYEGSELDGKFDHLIDSYDSDIVPTNK